MEDEEQLVVLEDRQLAKLQRIILQGFKSIKEMDIELRSLNILIGANGAGKSSLVSFFKMLNEMIAMRLQQYIGTTGRAQSILHFGPKVTPRMEAQLAFEVDNGVDTYTMRLFHAAGDTLVFADENLSFLATGYPKPKTLPLGSGHQETGIGQKVTDGEPTAKVFKHLLDRCRVYHFHDTSPTARVRQYCYRGDKRWLMPDAGNLAAFPSKRIIAEFPDYERAKSVEGPQVAELIGLDVIRKKCPQYA